MLRVNSHQPMRNKLRLFTNLVEWPKNKYQIEQTCVENLSMREILIQLCSKRHSINYVHFLHAYPLRALPRHN